MGMIINPYSYSTVPFSNLYSDNLDGVNEYISVPDTSLFSFTDGAGTDSAFSVGIWVYMNDATGFWAVSKGDDPSSYEYVFGTDGSDKLVMYLIKSDNSAYIRQISNSALTAYEGTWIYIMSTYSGSKTAGGIKLYVNGSAVAITSGTYGVYAGMTNGTGALRFGRYFNFGLYANGKIAYPNFFNAELSAAQCLEIYNAKMGDVRTTTAGGNVIAMWQFTNGQADYPTYDDVISTNDGTMTNQESTDINTDIPT